MQLPSAALRRRGPGALLAGRALVVDEAPARPGEWHAPVLRGAVGGAVASPARWAAAGQYDVGGSRVRFVVRAARSTVAKLPEHRVRAEVPLDVQHNADVQCRVRR